MASGHNTKAVANWFLDRFESNEKPCTQLQINKIVFIAHGYHLAAALDGSGMVNEPVWAWKHGPVFSSLREEFQHFGSRPITGRAEDLISEGSYYRYSLDKEDTKDWERKMLQWVYSRYGHLDGPSLIALTHKEGSPWAVVTKNGTDVGRDKEIPATLIRDYYGKILEQLRAPKS